MIEELIIQLEKCNDDLNFAFMQESRQLSSCFSSAIRFNGVSILPPVITKKRKEEIKKYREAAVKVEQRRNARRCITNSIISDNLPSPYTTSNDIESDTLPKELELGLEYVGGADALNPNSHSKHIDKDHVLLDTDNTPDFATLDSLTRDLMSLDDGSLPTEYSGLPLTTLRQQHISRVLGNLSETLNVADSLRSTASTLKNDSTLIIAQQKTEPFQPSYTDCIQDNLDDYDQNQNATKVEDIRSKSLLNNVSLSRDDLSLLPSSSSILVSPSNDCIEKGHDAASRGSDLERRTHIAEGSAGSPVHSAVIGGTILSPRPPSEPRTVKNKGHSRQGSYTLDYPSPALLKSISTVPKSESVRLDVPNSQVLSVSSDPTEIKATSQSLRVTEIQGKEDHLKRYLSYVQQQSQNEEVHDDGMLSTSIVNYSQTFAQSLLPEDWNELKHLSHEEILQLQNAHFETLRKDLMKHQQNQLDDLFRQQQLEQMKLQTDFEAKILKLSQLSPSLTDAVIKTTLDKEIFNPSIVTNNTINSSNIDRGISQSVISAIPVTKELHKVSKLYASPINHMSKNSIRINTQGNGSSGVDAEEVNKEKNNMKITRGPSELSPLSQTPDQWETEVKQIPSAKYVESPNIAYNPTVTDVSVFTTPKKKLFDESSVTFNNSPENVLRKPKIHTPNLSQPDVSQHTKSVTITKSFERLAAFVKGFLTRKLLKTEKVQELRKTIKDTFMFAMQFQDESSQNKEQFSYQDRELLERIIAQLQAALLEVHEIFFIYSTSAQMALIRQTRTLHLERQHRKSLQETTNMSHLKHAVSSATMKTLERRRTSQSTRESVIQKTTRPKLVSSQAISQADKRSSSKRKEPKTKSSHARDASTKEKSETSKRSKMKVKTFKAWR